MLRANVIAWTDHICRMMYVVFGDVIVVVGFEVEVRKNDERQEWCEV